MSAPIGGGAGAAQTVVVAARVALRVARGTEGADGLAAQAVALELRAARLAERNERAFAAALAALRGAPDGSLGAAMEVAAEIPGEIAVAAADVADLAAVLAHDGDPDLRADAVVAALLAEAAAAGAAHLVEINLTVAADDARVAAAHAAAGAAREAARRATPR
jgi:formiminotetrahydrofolate cyclodeaminase